MALASKPDWVRRCSTLLNSCCKEILWFLPCFNLLDLWSKEYLWFVFCGKMKPTGTRAKLGTSQGFGEMKLT